MWADAGASSLAVVRGALRCKWASGCWSTWGFGARYASCFGRLRIGCEAAVRSIVVGREAGCLVLLCTAGGGWLVRAASVWFCRCRWIFCFSSRAISCCSFLFLRSRRAICAARRWLVSRRDGVAVLGGRLGEEGARMGGFSFGEWGVSWLEAAVMDGGPPLLEDAEVSGGMSSMPLVQLIAPKLRYSRACCLSFGHISVGGFTACHG